MLLSEFVQAGFKIGGHQINCGQSFEQWASHNLADPDVYSAPILELVTHLLGGITKGRIREMYPVNYRERKQTRVAGLLVSYRNDFDRLLRAASEYASSVMAIERAVKALNEKLDSALIVFADDAGGSMLYIISANGKSKYKFHVHLA